MPKMVPKIILEGTRLTHKTDLAFRLNEHPRIVGPRKYKYHSPLISGEWCAFSNYPWGHGLINFTPEQEALAMETYMTQLSNRANDIMKVLSIIATIMLPLSLITGYFGMNFERMPWLGSRYAVYWLSGGMVVLALAMLAYFRHKRWF